MTLREVFCDATGYKRVDFYSPTAKNGKSSATEDIGEALAAILKNLSPEQLAALVSAAR